MQYCMWILAIVLLLIPQPAYANDSAIQLSLVRAYALLDYDGDGEEERGAGEGVEIQAFCEDLQVTAVTNEFSEAKFLLPYNDSPGAQTHCDFIATTHSLLYNFICSEGRFINEPQEYVFMNCTIADVRFLPFITTQVLAKDADEKSIQHFLPYLTSGQSE